MLRNLVRTRFVFVLPGLIFLIIFVAIPVASVFVMGFFKWNLLSPPRFVGLENFKMLLRDRWFWNSVWVSIKLLLLAVPMQFFVSLALALCLYKENTSSKILRAFFYWPYMMPAVAGTTMWKWLLSYDIGLLNHILRTIGLSPVPWLIKPFPALFSIALLRTWGMTGLLMVMFITGLQNVPQDYIEAAMIDGANRWQRFWYVVFPTMSNTNLLVLMTAIAHTLRSFAGVYVLTTGGPGYATTIIPLYIYQTAFTQFRIGYSYAASIVYFLIAFAVAMITLKLRESRS
ncbi:sugar ABC transporter permease [Thermotoga sp. RQ7]|jgi:alpha-1,4-digalacturonate transport system permease protein|uniref:carbohydrate ABC transporter permease n=1 Tax=Thermotoga sp. RQ7 TaxID=126738 RepID=UPI0005A30573|nr:sugar ABC transporter permease [Thermotoga sp. RQ7]AJG40374.1 sugar ABC transporter permease [Thermotoga sp. RQ7]